MFNIMYISYFYVEQVEGLESSNYDNLLSLKESVKKCYCLTPITILWVGGGHFPKFRTQLLSLLS